MKLHPDWKSVYKHWSTWVISLIGILAGVQEYLPFLKDYLPENTISVLAVVAIVCKLLDQNLKKGDDNVSERA